MPTRTHFTENLNELCNEIVRMSTLAEEAIQKSVEAFENKDTAAAEKIIQSDRDIDNIQVSIEDKCTVMIATEQPVATDLRRIITIIKLASNLERIGDHAVHLGRTTIRLAKESYIDTVLGLIPKMADIGLRMIREAISAFIERDVEKAKKTAELDEQIDRLHKEVFTVLIDTMKKDQNIIEQATDLLFINRFMERLGDHVTNMCEWVVFSMTGEHTELNR